jgi:hypothetical protein
VSYFSIHILVSGLSFYYYTLRNIST